MRLKEMQFTMEEIEAIVKEVKDRYKDSEEASEALSVFKLKLASYGLRMERETFVIDERGIVRS